MHLLAYILGSLAPLIFFISQMWRQPRTREKLDFGNISFYFSWAMYPLMGLTMFYLYNEIVADKLLAFHIGASAPIIFEFFGKSLSK